MAFTGTPVIFQVADGIFRLTGVSLAGDASGTIGFSDKTSPAEVAIHAPTWKPYTNGIGQDVSLQQAIEVTQNPVTDVTTPVPISVVKTGTTHADFLITMHNDTAGTLSGALEIYIKFHE